MPSRRQARSNLAMAIALTMWGLMGMMAAGLASVAVYINFIAPD